MSQPTGSSSAAAATAVSAPAQPQTPQQRTAAAGGDMQFLPATFEGLSTRPNRCLAEDIMMCYRACRVMDVAAKRRAFVEQNAAIDYNLNIIKIAKLEGKNPDTTDYFALKPRPSERQILTKMIAANPTLPFIAGKDDLNKDPSSDRYTTTSHSKSTLQQRLNLFKGFADRYNNGFDDREGHYYFIPGDEVSNRFIISQVLGKGSFGTVMKAVDLKTMEAVAVKISRSGAYFINQAKLEVDILLRVNGNPKLACLAVKLRKYVMWQQHAVLVFQLLSINLYQLLKLSRHNGVSLDLTRKFGVQIFQLLAELEKNNPPIIHCDLKPENVLLNDQARSGIRVIDFGSACYDSPLQEKHKYIQSRFYRSPEVILGLPYGTAIDRWSLGCILIEMHIGTPVFPGRSEAEQLARMEALLGPAPSYMIAQAAKRDKLYACDVKSASNNNNTNQSRAAAAGGGAVSPVVGGPLLATPVGVPYALIRQPDASFPTSLDDMIGTYSGGPRGMRKGHAGHTEKDYEHFADFIRRLLTYDPAKRMSCEEAMRHPFFQPLVASMQTHQQQQQQQRPQSSQSQQPPPAPTLGPQQKPSPPQPPAK